MGIKTWVGLEQDRTGKEPAQDWFWIFNPAVKSVGRIRAVSFPGIEKFDDGADGVESREENVAELVDNNDELNDTPGSTTMHKFVWCQYGMSLLEYLPYFL